MITDELTGTLVLVHPELEFDPAGRRNEIGIIVNSDITNDNILVSFQDNTYDLFASDALLLLLPAEDIHRNLAGMDIRAPWEDIKALTQIDLVLRYGTGDKHFKALELARANKNVQSLCLQIMEHSLDINRGHGYEC